MTSCCSFNQSEMSLIFKMKQSYCSQGVKTCSKGPQAYFVNPIKQIIDDEILPWVPESFSFLFYLFKALVPRVTKYRLGSNRQGESEVLCCVYQNLPGGCSGIGKGCSGYLLGFKIWVNLTFWVTLANLCAYRGGCECGRWGIML